MYIIAIAWIYVTLLMAATESSFVGGVLTFLLYGLGPLAVFLYLFGRRRARKSVPVRQSTDDPHGHHPESDQ